VLEKDRDIAMVFQNYALYPHMTVAQNIAFSLRSRDAQAEIKRRVHETGPVGSRSRKCSTAGPSS